MSSSSLIGEARVGVGDRDEDGGAVRRDRVEEPPIDVQSKGELIMLAEGTLYCGKP